VYTNEQSVKKKTVFQGTQVNKGGAPF